MATRQPGPGQYRCRYTCRHRDACFPQGCNMKRFTAFQLAVMMCLSIACNSADFLSYIDKESEAYNAAEPGVTIIYPGDEEYIETLNRDDDGNIVSKPIVFQGLANDGYFERITDNSAYVWSSSVDGVLGTGQDIDVSNSLSPGTHQVTLQVADIYGGTDSRTVTVHVPRVFTEDFSNDDDCDKGNTTGVWETGIGAHLGSSTAMGFIGSCELQGTAKRIAVAGHYAYVTSDEYGLVIVDISNPANPVPCGSCSGTEGSPSVVAVSGNYAYIGYRNPDALVVINVSNPSSPSFVRSLTISVNDLAVADNYLYVGVGHCLLIYSLETPSNPISTPIKTFLCNPDGPVLGVAVQGNYAYLASNQYELIVVNISDKNNPVIVNPLSTWCIYEGWGYDIAVSGNYAFVADVNQSGLLILDITNPAVPVMTGFYKTNGDPSEVAVSGNYAYIVSSSSGLVDMVDVSDKTKPELAGRYEMSNGLQGITVSGECVYLTGGSSIAILNPNGYFGCEGICYLEGIPTHVAVSGNYAYVCNNGSSGTYMSGLNVINISNPSNPVAAAYTNSFMYTPRDIAVSGNYAYMADYNKLVIIDIRNPSASDWNPPVYTRSTNEIYGIAVAGNYVYTCAGSNGLLIHSFNQASPDNPVPAGTYNTAGDARGVAVSGNYAYIADGSNGLVVVDISNPVTSGWNPAVYTCSYSASANAGDIAVSGNYAYISDNNVGLVIINISNPAAPVLTAILGTPGKAVNIAVAGDYAYVSCSGSGMVAVNISDPAHPAISGVCSKGGDTQGLFISGNYVYAALGSGMMITGTFRKNSELYSDEQQEVRSRTVVATSFSNVRFLYNGNSNNQFLNIEMSCDGGITWNSAADRLRITLQASSSDLRWRAVMRTSNIVETPAVSRICIEYWE